MLFSPFSEGEIVLGDERKEWSTLTRRQQALALLRLADLGIEDVVIDRQEVLSSTGETMTQRRLRLLHRSGNDSAPLDFSAESEGTRTWFGLIGAVLTALQSGSIVIFDGTYLARVSGEVRWEPGAGGEQGGE
ncbi:AAA family ATPase, partial [Micromonospora sp. DT4]|uniref:AAA family ATPase n=1 Tax=Micromonospora sp. DT4 TaxID=3393438 RepID=UPI003CF5859F